MDWALVTFDKATTAEQRKALGEIIGYVFPVKWESFQTVESNIDTWPFDKNTAHAILQGPCFGASHLEHQGHNP